MTWPSRISAANSATPAASFVPPLVQRLDQVEGRAPATQPFVDVVHQSLPLGWQVRTSMDKGAPVGCLQVRGDGGDPSRRILGRTVPQHGRCQRIDGRQHLARSGDETVIRRPANQRGDRFGGVDPAHRAPDRVAAAGEVAGVAQVTGCGTDQVAIQGQQHVSVCDPRHKVQPAAVGQLRSAPGRIARDGFPLPPPCAGVSREQPLDRGREGGGCDPARQDPKACARRCRRVAPAPEAWRPASPATSSPRHRAARPTPGRGRRNPAARPVRGCWSRPGCRDAPDCPPP